MTLAIARLQARSVTVVVAVALLLGAGPLTAATGRVIGSFADPENAARAARQFDQRHPGAVAAASVPACVDGRPMWRVVVPVDAPGPPGWRWQGEAADCAALAAGGFNGPLDVAVAQVVARADQPAAGARGGAGTASGPAGAAVPSPPADPGLAPPLPEHDDQDNVDVDVDDEVDVGGNRPAGPGRMTAHHQAGVEGRFFPFRSARGAGVVQGNLRLASELDWRAGDGRFEARVAPWLALDSLDPDRSRADLREAWVGWNAPDFAIRAGLRREFWGVTEFSHLVDVLNQVDLVEDIDGEERLGQPMLQLSVPRSSWALDFYVLPGFRERPFPDAGDGRLGLPLPIAEGAPDFESGAGRWHVDGAVRWTATAGGLDVALAHFRGTARDPRFGFDPGRGRLVPRYDIIDQTSLEAQWTTGAWLLKLEALTRGGQDERFAAVVAGFEWTQAQAFGTRADLGWIVEAMWDERDAAALPGTFEHDVALGLRWSANDARDSTLLAGAIVDVRSGEALLSLEASRRLATNWKLLVEARSFEGADGPGDDPVRALRALTDPDNKLAFLAREDYLMIELVRYF